MEKFADAWWDYVGGVGSRELNADRKYYKIDEKEKAIKARARKRAAHARDARKKLLDFS